MQLLILALDGFDPRLFEQWRGDLPNLDYLARQGTFQPLTSTIPPMTFPAWSTCLTGVNPGQHGIFDFTERLPSRYGVRFLNATRRRYPTFLRLASDQGLKIGSIGLPTTYPPEPLSGYQISGFDTPLPSKADPSYIHPRDLAYDLERDLGGFYFGDFNESRVRKGWHQRVLAKLLAGLKRKRDLVRYLQQKIPVDLLLLHVGETDTVGHHFWSYYDSLAPRHVSPSNEALSEAIRTVYKAADNLVGSVCEMTHPQVVLVVSDHGMGGSSDRMIYLNRFLSGAGFLCFTANQSSRWIERVKHLGMNYLPYRMQGKILKMAGGSVASSIESRQRFGCIDWSKTFAFSEELNYFPAISLNLKGREPAGLVTADRVPSLTDELTAALLAWRDPQDGHPIVRRVMTREQVYTGPEIGFAPDFLLELRQPGGYSYASGRSTSSEGQVPWRKLQSSEYLGRKGGSMNGSHRQEGIYISNHPHLRATGLLSLNLLDIAPTVLGLLGLQIPPWMERPGLLEASSSNLSIGERITEIPLTPQEETRLQRQLVNLGYLS